MNRDTLLTAFVAICCIGAVGVSATTLESTLPEDPDDVVRLDYDQLPTGENDAGGAKTPTDRESQSSAGSDGNENDREGSAASRTPAGGHSGGAGAAGRGTAPAESPLERLWSLLPVVAALAVAGLAYRYRSRLAALVLALRAGLGDDGAVRATGDAAREWPGGAPDDEVTRAWLAMVRRLDVPRPQSRTPLECARAAVDAGMDPDAVETLTQAFVEVRYGDRPVTEERRERAREGLRRLDERSS